MAEQPQSGLMQPSPRVDIFVVILDVNMLAVCSCTQSQAYLGGNGVKGMDDCHMPHVLYYTICNDYTMHEAH